MSTTVISSNWATYGSGSYWALNNVWGAGKLVNGIDYTESISFDPSTFPDGVTMSWNWPAATSVLAYPEIVYGTQQSMPAPAGVTMPAPTQVANFTNLSAQYSFSISGQTNNFDVGFDLWLTSQPNSGIKDELMVFVHDPWGSANGASNIGSLNNSGIYVSYNWGNATQSWTYVQLVPSADSLSGTISFSDILKTLMWNGVLTGKEYISGIELGAEVGGGSGSLTVNNLSYQWDANQTITGTSGNDTFHIAAAGGNDVVGNGGVDTVVYSGTFSQFEIKASGSETLVMENNSISSLDVLSGVTYVKFSDGTYDTVTSTFTPTTATAPVPTVASFSPDTAKIGDGITDAAVITLNGTAEANSTVAVFDGKTELGTATVNSNGTWAFTTGTLANGTHTFAATDTDASGTSAASSALAVTVDTIAPTPTFGNLVHNSNGTVTLSGTSEANSTVSIYDGTTDLGTVTTAANGAWNFTTGKLSTAVHTFSLAAMDVAGNAGSGTNVVLYGPASHEAINIGPANDLVTVLGSSDTFVFGSSLGKDVITGFQATGSSHDTLQFSQNTFNNFASVLAHAAQVGSDVVITVDPADSVTLKNVHLSSLQKSDIHIV